jgi:pimeloyl-ACP methyl ester carboxylesterase
MNRKNRAARRKETLTFPTIKIPMTIRSGTIHRSSTAVLSVALMLILLAGAGCKSVTPIGADRTSTASVYRQTHNNPIGYGGISRETQEILHRFEQTEEFGETPDATLAFLRRKAVETRERGLLFALAELSYLEGDRVRKSVKAWDTRDARDYYLASAVYAWLFLLGDANGPAPSAYDQRFRTACDLYNFGLGLALTSRGNSEDVVKLVDQARPSPVGEIDIKFDASHFQYPMGKFDRFLVADQFVVRGLSMRNRQSGLGTPLMAMAPSDHLNKLARAIPATVLLRVEGGITNLAADRLSATLELYSPFDDTEFEVGDRTVPLQTDTTITLAYALNQSSIWKLGRMQFLSGVERIPTGVYLPEPYRPGRIPVVFVHGTFSSPIKWAEMANTLSADPELRRRCQFWYFIYNSGNPTLYSAERLRESLQAKIKQLDPDGDDRALENMVVIGHSQGGLLTKLTATDTGDKLLATLLKTNAVGVLNIPSDKEAKLRKYLCIEPLPFVTRVVFISTPHRGSYGSTGLARRLTRKVVSLPGQVMKMTTDFTGLTEGLELPPELRGTPTSVDSMSPNNPLLLSLADIPVAPGIKANSIIAVKGDGDYKEGKDELVKYSSAHQAYTESELIVRGPHSCQHMPPAIEEVRRILHEHLKELPKIQPAVKEGK